MAVVESALRDFNPLVGGLSLTAYRAAASRADKIEFEALRLGIADLGTGIEPSVISEELDEEYGIDGDTAVDRSADKDVAIESALSNAQLILSERSQRLGKAYPFLLQSGSVKYRGSFTLVYELCLAITQVPSFKKAPLCTLPRHFERLLGNLISLWLGDNAEWYRLGWPPEEDRPERLKNAIEEVHSRTGEWHWKPLLAGDQDPKPADAKDCGIDVIAWKRFPDRLLGSLFLFGQCSCGRTEWDDQSKWSDGNGSRIRKYVPRLTLNDHWVRFFATPYDVSHQRLWQDMTINAGLVFDRLRISSLCESRMHAEQIRKAVGQQFSSLIRLVVPEFRIERRWCQPTHRRRQRRGAAARRFRWP